MNSSSPENPNGKKYSPVFIYSATAVAMVVLLGVFLPRQFNYVTNDIRMQIIEKLDWYCPILITIIVFFRIFLTFSLIRKSKLDKPSDKPKFNTISRFTTLFNVGIRVGLVFYSAAEPMAYFTIPPTADPKTTETYIEALYSISFRWGLHAWAIYGAVALTLAYLQFRKGESGLLPRTLHPLLGDRVEDPIGILTNVLSAFVIVVGVVISSGMGALQVNGGLHYLFNVPNNTFVQTTIIIVVTILFITSIWSRLSKGTQYLNNLSVGLGTILMVAALIVGSTVLVLNMLTSSTGSLLNTLLFNSFDTVALDS